MNTKMKMLLLAASLASYADAGTESPVLPLQGNAAITAGQIDAILAQDADDASTPNGQTASEKPEKSPGERRGRYDPPQLVQSHGGVPKPEEQRSCFFSEDHVSSPFALIPADSEFVMGVFNIGETIKRMAGSKLFRLCNDGEAGRVPMQVACIEDVVISFGKGSAENFRSMIPVYAEMNKIRSAKLVADLFDDQQHADIWINKLPEDMLDNTAKAAAQWLRMGHVPPMLAVVTFDTNMAPLVASQMPVMIDMLKRQAGEWPYEFHEGDYAGMHFAGICIDGDKAVAMMEKDLNTMSTKGAFLKPLAEALPGRKLYVLVAMHDGKIIVSMTEDPKTQLKLAASVKETVLGSGKLSFAADLYRRVPAKLYKPNFLYYVDKELMEVSRQMDKAKYGAMIQFFEKFAGMVHGGGREDLKAVKASLSGLSKALDSWIDLQEPGEATCIIWEDGGINVEMTAGRTRLFDDGRKLALISLADNPDTILFMEQAVSPEASKIASDLVEEAAACAWFGIQAWSGNQEMPVDVPAVQAVWKSLGTMVSGMGSDGALIVDGQGSFPKDFSPATQHWLDQMTVPRIALYRNVTNRAGISAGWDELQQAAGQMALKSGLKRVDVDKIGALMKKIRSTPVSGGGSMYALAGSEESPNCVPNLLLTDKSWVLGTSRLWNEEIAKAAQSETGTATGLVFSLRMEGIKRYVDRNAPFAAKIMGDSAQVDQVVKKVSELYDAFEGIDAAMSNTGDKSVFRLKIKTK